MARPQPPGPFPPLQPGQQPTPDQIRQMQQQIAAEAQKAGISVPQYVERLKAQAQQNHQRMQMMQQQQRAQQQQQGQQQMQQGGAQPGQQVPIAPGPPKLEALAVAAFLRSQNLELRTCIFQEKRKDMFKVKRAIRALHSPAYEKARKKNALLPEVKDRVTAENTFKLLPLSLLALRVSKVDEKGHEGHAHAKKKRVKGLWTVKVEPQQEAGDEFHYVWLFEGSQWKNKLYAVGALALILAVVFFPVWPYHLRLGVWYLSMGMLGLLGLFFAMAIFRLILFLITMFAKPPGLWLFPNLFEDVGFFDSFKPAWAWHEDEKAVKRRKKDERDRKRTKRAEKAAGGGSKADTKSEKPAIEPAPTISKPITASAPGTVRSAPLNGNVATQQQNLTPRVEEVEDD
ncbi:Translocation protein S62 [Friedmanniomyces endolithicus]|uniref:Translocation protein SEC62 n=1 Tax=Friedmanniomyces endolithicus TaxID=329885 RepID=A0AAN6KZL7_9PEZI|nr:Translocation protein S62 [Friedmanniomyces endolithicus]KAK0962812.1 Translocation protein S62 [Friedmanniomyces endolithicus]KAK1011776.1 Translocation protein S62 [Friedmanniomyces endolithicus]KAK1046961.1 Translocation protein S62 [Friedmanniomyces endolithicus]